MKKQELLDLIEEERSRYFQYIMCVHCDDDSEIKLDEDQAHHVLYTFTERLNKALAEALDK